MGQPYHGMVSFYRRPMQPDASKWDLLACALYLSWLIYREGVLPRPSIRAMSRRLDACSHLLTSNLLTSAIFFFCLLLLQKPCNRGETKRTRVPFAGSVSATKLSHPFESSFHVVRNAEFSSRSTEIAGCISWSCKLSTFESISWVYWLLGFVDLYL